MGAIAVAGALGSDAVLDSMVRWQIDDAMAAQIVAELRETAGVAGLPDVPRPRDPAAPAAAIGGFGLGALAILYFMTAGGTAKKIRKRSGMGD